MGRGSPAEIMPASSTERGADPRGGPGTAARTPGLQVVTAKRVVERDATAEGLLRARPPRSPGAGRSVGAGRDSGDRVFGERRQVTIVSCRLTVEPALVAPRWISKEVDHLLHAQHATISRSRRSTAGAASAIADRVVLLSATQASGTARDAQCGRPLDVVASVARTNQRGVEHRIPLDVRVGIHTGLVVARDTVNRLRSISSESRRRRRRRSRRARRAGDPAERRDPRCCARIRRRKPGAASDIGVRCADRAVPCRRRLLGLGRAAQLAAFRLLPSVGVARSRRSRKRGENGGSPGTVRAALGEAGVGKSRLLQGASPRGTGRAWLACRCTPENHTSPLRPFVDLLGAVREPLGDLLARNGLEVATVLPLFEALLAAPRREFQGRDDDSRAAEGVDARGAGSPSPEDERGAPVVLAIEDLALGRRRP